MRINPVSSDRYYAVYIYNACNFDKQVFPAGGDLCRNDDGHHPSALPSTCVTIPSGHIPVGITPAACGASAEASVALHAAVSPETYDIRSDTALTVTTSFSDDFRQRLSEATCTGILSWNTVAWTLVWPDGHVDTLPGTGDVGTAATHTLAARKDASSSAPADVTAIAHLHIRGTALDFDSSGAVVATTRDAYVDISNHAAADGSGSAPVYAPPRLAVGAIGVAQAADGTFGPVDPSTRAATHLDAIYGRLLRVYPQAIVVAPGTESIAGVIVGVSTTTTARWTYAGGYTDAPAGEATPPGATGGLSDFIQVQYNHAERIDGRGERLDEHVPVILVATTTYPDGHVETASLSSAVGVTIYYVGLNFTG